MTIILNYSNTFKAVKNCGFNESVVASSAGCSNLYKVNHTKTSDYIFL